ncbi:MAG: hypothetical protein JST11_10355 [Acidobacteria bacterium]|nr:hypothetical protein [Acidobacteriota bacterium]
MDATQKSFKLNLLLIVALAGVLAAPGWSQTAFSLSATTVNLNQNGAVNVNSTGAAITFTTATTYASDGGNGVWLTVSPGGAQTTPALLGLQLNQTAGLTAGNTYTATVTLSGAGVAPATITVTYTAGGGSGGGGGGGGTGITLSNTISTLTTPVNGSTVYDNSITISTSSSSSIGLTVSSTLTSCTSQQWLTASLNISSITSGAPATLNIAANPYGLSAGLCNATITITPTSGAAATVSVTFSVGSSGSGGIMSVAPSTVSLNYTTGSTPSASQSVTVTDNSGAPSVKVTWPSTAAWLSVNGSFFEVAVVPNSTITLALSSSVQGLTTGSYSTTLNLSDTYGNTASITVNLSVNGGTSSGLTVTPSSLAFSSAVGGGQQTANLSVISTTGGAFTATASSTGGWLTATAGSSSLVSNTAGSVAVGIIPTNLASGTYSGNITVTVGSQSQSVGVTLTVGSGGSSGGTSAVSPSTVQLYWQAGTSTGFISRPDIVITGPSGNWSSSVTYQQGSGWISLSPASGTSLPAQPTIIVDPSTLGVGTYTGTILIATPGGTQTVTVNVAVTSAAVLTARPGSVIFYAQSGGAATAPNGSVVQFSTADGTLNNALDVSNAWTANASWISVIATPKYIVISADPKGLTGGVYSSTVTIAPSGLGSITVPVVLVIDNGVGGGGGTGPFTFSPSSLAFSAATGSSPTSQQIAISANTTTTFSITSNQNWLTVSPAGGSTPNNITVSAAAAGLAAGTYTGTLTFTSGSGTTQNFPVTLTVTSGGGGGGASGNVTVSPTSLTFSAQKDQGNPAIQTLAVTSASGSAGVSFTVTPTTTSGGNWLFTSAGNAVQTTPLNQLVVSVQVANLAGGTYQGNLAIAPTGGTVVNVPVTLTLTAPGISASPTSLTFNYRAGQSAPAAQQLAVSGNGGALAFTAVAASTGNWLAVSPASGTTAATGTVPLSVSIDPTKITAAGTYNGTVTVAGSGTATGSTVVNVTLTVTAPLPTVTKVTNAASYVQGVISPGEIITLFGTDIGPATAAGLQLDSSGKVATTLGGAQVQINGYSAPLIYVSNTQVSAVVPYEIAQFANANVLVRFLGQTSNGVAVNVATTVPGLFTQNASGSGPGAILNQNGSVNAPSNPAARGDTIVIYLTGEGQTAPAGVTGKVTTVSATPPLTPAPLLPIGVTIGGQPANYTFAGEAPGFVSGVMQLNVVVPPGVASGAQPVIVSIGGNQSQNTVTVSIQ